MARHATFATSLLPLGAVFRTVCLAVTGLLAVAERPAQAQAPSVGWVGGDPIGLARMFTGVCVSATDAAARAAFQTSMVAAHGVSVPTFSVNVREGGGGRYVRARIEVPW